MKPSIKMHNYLVKTSNDHFCHLILIAQCFVRNLFVLIFHKINPWQLHLYVGSELSVISIVYCWNERKNPFRRQSKNLSTFQFKWLSGKTFFFFFYTYISLSKTTTFILQQHWIMELFLRTINHNLSCNDSIYRPI